MRNFKGKRFPVDTLHHLRQKYPEENWATISLRKQVCILYITWMVYPNKKECKYALIEKVKEWRTKEPNRLGGKRSVLEKLCRKFFQEHRRDKAKNSEESFKARQKKGVTARDNNTEIFREDLFNYRKTSEHGRWLRSHFDSDRKALHWYVYTPEGERLEVFNMLQFCRERGFHKSWLSRTSLRPGKTYKGWRAEKRNLDIDPLTDD
jgi:hypothetical protein